MLSATQGVREKKCLRGLRTRILIAQSSLPDYRLILRFIPQKKIPTLETE